MKDKIFKYIVLMSIPFFIGCVGYYQSGARISDSMYASFALYFINPVSDAYNYWIEIARWTAALVAVTAIVCAIKVLFNNIYWWIKSCVAKNSIAIYSDSNVRVAFGDKTKPIYPGEKFIHAAKIHMLLFSSDEKNIKLYEENKARIDKSKVYIGIRDIDYGLLKQEENVYFFDINGSIARLLWKKISIWKAEKREQKIVIIGDGALAANVLNYGLLMNLYSKEQHITYHFISNNNNYESRHPKISIENGNNDVIIYHDMKNLDFGDIIRNADITIIADVLPTEILQTVCVNAINNKVYYYSPQNVDVMDYLSIGEVIPFGRDKEIFTDENILQEKLLKSAKCFNDYYASMHNGEKDWSKLSGFIKWSNISVADFADVIKDILKARTGEKYQVLREELAELEHIRWCRFHYLNYWEYGEPINGKNKDEINRIHKCLRPYKELEESEKNKDRDVVDVVLNIVC